jgi:hypothetical protein
MVITESPAQIDASFRRKGGIAVSVYLIGILTGAAIVFQFFMVPEPAKLDILAFFVLPVWMILVVSLHVVSCLLGARIVGRCGGQRSKLLIGASCCVVNLICLFLFVQRLGGK